MSSPILWGPNSTSNSLQNRMILANGALISNNGNKNYVTYGNLENGLATGWSLARTALSSLVPSTTVTAGSAFSVANGALSPSAGLSVSATSTNPLGGLYSLNLASSGTPTVGDMLISQVYNIELEDRGRYLNFSFYYQLVSGTSFNFTGTSANNFAIYIYDVTSGAWISPSGVYSMTDGSGVGLATGNFAVPSGMTQFQIAIVEINSYSTAAYSLYVDDVSVGPVSIATLSSPVNARYEATFSTAVTSGNPIVFDTKIFDTNSAYSTTTGEYTAPVSGTYQIDARCYLNGFASIFIYKNGNQYSEGTQGTTVNPATIADLVYLDKGDTVFVAMDGTGSTSGGGILSSFSIFLTTPTVGISPATQATPTVQKLLSGSGTYTLPTNPTPLYIRVRMVGGGGGGGGGSTNNTGGAAGNGGDTTFGSSFLFAGGGGGADGSATNTGGAGGTASIGTGAVGLALTGTRGNDGTSQGAGATGSQPGANSPFGGAGAGTINGLTGRSADANSGSGGAAGTATTGGEWFPGSGAAGGYIDAIVTSPAASYSYSIGAGGTAGAPGTNGNAGGAGGSGVIIVEEFYPANTIPTTPNGNAPTVQTFTSGSGTYTRPSSPAPLWIKVRVVGGGGGGLGSGSSVGSAPTAGGNSDFGSTLLVANGGSVAGTFGQTGAGGTASLGSGVVGATFTGQDGTAGQYQGIGTIQLSGGPGGISVFGGGGVAGSGASNSPGGNAKTNSGSGGGGGSIGGISNAFSGSGGGAGGYAEGIIMSPSASYSYSVGASGSAGSAGASGTAGGNGAAGIIIVEEYYAASSTITSVISGGGGGSVSVQTITTATATLTTSDDYVIVNYGAGTCNISIPGAAASGTVFNIKTITTQPVIVTPTSGTVDGASTLTVSGQYTSANIVSDGTNYFVV